MIIWLCKLSSRNNWVDSGYLRLTSIPPKKSGPAGKINQSTSHLPLQNEGKDLSIELWMHLLMRNMSWPFTRSWQEDLYVLRSLYFCWWKLILTALLLCVKQYGVHLADWMFWRFQPILVFPIQYSYLSKIWSFLTMLLHYLQGFLQGSDKVLKWSARNWGNLFVWGNSGNLGGIGAVQKAHSLGSGFVWDILDLPPTSNSGKWRFIGMGGDWHPLWGW